MKWREGMDPVSRWETVDKDLATFYLSLNVENRPMKSDLVDKYASDMKEGRWMETAPATPIAFTWDGKLINGQNRLLAVVRSGTAIKFQVMEGCDPKSFEYIDIGKNRDSSDIFYVEYKRLKGEAPKYHRYATSTARAMLVNIGSKTKFGRVEVKDCTMEWYQFIVRYLELMNKQNCHAFGTTVVAAFVNAERYLGNRSRDRLTDLAGRFGSGLWLPEDPMKVLSDAIIAADMPRRGTHQKTLLPEERYGVAVNAIRAALSGKVVKRLEPTSQDWGCEHDVRLKVKVNR